MIQVRNLSKHFMVENNAFKAVDNVTFDVADGEIYGIIGLSGAGKSTLIRCLNRLEEATDGTIEIDGQRITDMSKSELNDFRKKIGMIFQHYNLFHQKTVFENIAFPLRLIGEKKEAIQKRVHELLEFVSLTDKAKSYPASLSGGQKQRVAIARALANNPKLLLCDEATSALDPSSTKQILKLLRKTVEVYGTTIVLITHQLEVAKEISDRVAVMENGKIVEENTVTELFRRPKSRLAIQLIESMGEKSTEDTLHFEHCQGEVYRLGYDEKTSREPLLTQCIRECNVDVSILSGNITQLSQAQVGHLFVEFIGETENINQALQLLREKGVSLRAIKHGGEEGWNS